MASSNTGFAGACKRVAARGTDALKGAFEWVRSGGRRRQLAVGATAVGVVTALALSTMNAQAEPGISVTAQGYPAGTSAMADPSTLDGYKTFPTGDAYDTTEYAGRIWTDKTVIVPTDANDPSKLGKTAVIGLADLTRDFDGDGPWATAGKAEVDMTDRSVFLTCISALSSSLMAELVEPVPLDIVLVLDVSGSMKETTGSRVYTAFTEEQMMHLTIGSKSLPDGTYFKNRSNSWMSKAGWEGYIWVSKNPDGSDAQRVPYIDKGGDLYILIRGDSVVTDRSRERETEQWYYSKSENGSSWTQYDFGYALLYGTDKMNELHAAALDFIDAIAQNNTDIASQGYDNSYQSQISVIKFSDRYLNTTWDNPDYHIGDGTTSRTQILTPLTVLTNDTSGPVKTLVNGLKAEGGTAADLALTLAKGVFDGEAINSSGQTEDGARDGARKVVVFFTDGNPKHERGSAPNDFSGLIAQQTFDQAYELKNDDVTIYSVAVVDGADAGDTTLNLNIYLNGVSSNYPDAMATGGQDNPVSGLVAPASNTWNPSLGTRAEAYALTSDTVITPRKTYYTRSGRGTTSDPYVYTAVSKPSADELATYYEPINYYLTVSGGQSITDAFMKILNQINSSGEESTATGRDGNTALTITDYLGDYMEFKGLDGILYGVSADTTQLFAPGTQDAYHSEAQVQFINQTDTESIYTMWADVPSALLEPPEGKENVHLSSITVKVTRSSDAKTGDTVTITIPPDLIPSLRYAVTQRNAGVGTSVEASRTDADPLRIFYSVGPKTSTLDTVLARMEDEALRAENATNDSDRQSDAFRSFLQDAARYGADGIYPLYSNRPTYGEGDDAYTVQTADEGEATVSMVLSETNPYYFFVENEPLFVETSAGSGEYRPAESADADADHLYYCAKAWSVIDNTEVTEYRAWNGDKTSVSGLLCIPAGTPKTSAHAAEAMTNVSFDKIENTTGTATTSLVSVFDGTTEAPSGTYVAQQYLGNNGRLDIPVYGTLAVTKNITAGEGFNLPTNPVPSAHFTLELKDKDGGALTQDDTYRALIRNAAGHPIDPETHAVVTNADTAKFYVKNGSKFTLRDGETIKVTNLPDGATYKVTEEGQPGYKATVTNNNGFERGFDRGADAVTEDATDA